MTPSTAQVAGELTVVNCWVCEMVSSAWDGESDPLATATVALAKALEPPAPVQVSEYVTVPV